jgi:hypothetical protein
MDFHQTQGFLGCKKSVLYVEEYGKYIVLPLSLELVDYCAGNFDLVIIKSIENLKLRYLGCSRIKSIIPLEVKFDANKQLHGPRL